MLYLIEFGFNNPNEYKVFFFIRPNVYGTQEEFIEKESMARNSYLEFRKIVQECIDAGNSSRLLLTLSAGPTSGLLIGLL